MGLGRVLFHWTHWTVSFEGWWQWVLVEPQILVQIHLEKKYNIYQYLNKYLTLSLFISQSMDMIVKENTTRTNKITWTNLNSPVNIFGAPGTPCQAAPFVTKVASRPAAPPTPGDVATAGRARRRPPRRRLSGEFCRCQSANKNICQQNGST